MPNHPLVVYVSWVHDVYCGRPSKWGNPYTHQPGIPGTILVESREEAIWKYEHVHLPSRPDLMAALCELRGKTLGCWCVPNPCHCDVLARLANAPTP